MAFRRVAAAALLQALLLGCGVALAAALRAGFVASATAIGLVALWIGAAAAWQARLRPAAAAPAPPPRSGDEGRAQLLASLLDQTPAPLVTRDARGGFQAANRAARRLFRTDGALRPAPPALAEAMEREGAPGRTVAEVGEGGAMRTYAVSLSDVAAADGALRLAVLLDIEPELRAAEARALRELLQVLGHEIMNGLTPVASLAATASELLAAGDPASRAQAQEALDVLARRADGLARFAEGYRTLARLPPPVRAPASLAGLMEEAARLFRSRWAAVALEVRPPSPDVRLAIDRDQVMHALGALLTNAAEAATSTGGAPRVELAAAPAPDGSAALRVGDNGPGVAPELRERVGQPFFTTKPEGTGVGLSLARQIAHAHGGSLELRPDAPGGGAVFELRLSG